MGRGRLVSVTTRPAPIAAWPTWCCGAAAQGPGMPICYTWIEWLSTGSLDAIGATSALQLSREAAQDASAGAPPPTVAAGGGGAAGEGPGRTADQLLMQLMLYEAARDFHIFQAVRKVAQAKVP